MIFIDNKYTRIYFKIIDRAKQRDCIDYVESHHIIPKSFFKSRSKTGWLSGDSEGMSNKVLLTPREHFLCHMLLIKMTDGIGRWKMSFALKRFVYAKNHKNRITSRTYDYIRKINIDQMKGKSPSAETREKIRQGNLNRAPASEETRKKLSDAAKRRKGFTEEGRKRVVESSKARVWTEESKQKLRQKRAEQVERQGSTMTDAARLKLSAAAKGRTLSDDHKNKISQSNKGKTRSPEVVEKLRQISTGKIKSKETLQKLREKASKDPKPKITCPICGKTGGEPSMKRWHFDNCKSINTIKDNT